MGDRTLPALFDAARGGGSASWGWARSARAIARRLEAFGVSIAYSGRTRQPGVLYAYHPSAVELAAASDVLIAVVPGGPGTRHLIDAPVLAALGPDGVLINVARGSAAIRRR